MVDEEEDEFGELRYDGGVLVQDRQFMVRFAHFAVPPGVTRTALSYGFMSRVFYEFCDEFSNAYDIIFNYGAHLFVITNTLLFQSHILP